MAFEPRTKITNKKKARICEVANAIRCWDEKKNTVSIPSQFTGHAFDHAAGQHGMHAA